MARRRTTPTTDDQTTETTGAAASTDAANADAAPAPATARRGRRPRTDTSSNASESATAANVAEIAPAAADDATGAGANLPAAPPATEAPGATADSEQPQRKQRRRRRRSTIDTAAEARLLVAALLRQRGLTGARQDEVQQVVAWGRSTRAESQELQKGQKGGGSTGSRGRARRPSGEVVAQAQRSELNTLLLEGVLGGTLALDVRGDSLVFFPAGDRVGGRGNGNAEVAPASADLTHLVNADTEYYRDGPQRARPPDGTFAGGTRVRLVQGAGSYSLVTSETGITAYVALGSLEPIEE